MSALTRLTATETKLFFREPIMAFFGLAVPPLLLVILGAIPAFREPDKALGGVRLISLYVPIVIAMSLAVFALNGLPQVFATYREQGVLRRMRTTPVRPEVMLGAQLVMSTMLSVATMLVVLAVGRLVFGVSLPRQFPAFLVSYVLAALSMFALGLVVTSLAPNGRSAGPIGSAVLYPIMFFAGLWVPRAGMNDVLRTISDFTPLGAGVQALQDATAGHWPQPSQVAVMLGWTIAAVALAARYFRWE